MTEQRPPELGLYLRARRAVVTPGELGLPTGGGRRRTPGLRREELAALAGELVVKSPDFSRMWERYDVRKVGHGQKTFLNPELGRMTLSHEVLEVVRTQDQRLVVYSAEPGTPDHDAIVLLDVKGTGALNCAAAPSEEPVVHPVK